METFFGCLLIWFVVSIFYAIMCPRGIGSGKIGNDYSCIMDCTFRCGTKY